MAADAGIEFDSLILRNGLYYRPFSNSPYSGLALYSGLRGGDLLNGLMDGLWTTRHPNGLKIMEGEYRKGVQVGVWTSWNEEGRKVIEGEYKDGEREGRWTWWDENEQKSMEAEYRNGVLVDSHC